jgi:hypothetical protein
VRVVVHAGLHKSGTTTTQTLWREGYRDSTEVVYPRRGGGAPGHHYLVRGLLSAFTEQTDPDLVRAGTRWALAGRRTPRLARALAEAEASGARAFVLSAEVLDRVRPRDVEVLREAFRGHRVEWLLTATAPAHRWSAGWTTLVKHGLGDYPAEAGHTLLRFAALSPGRLEELAGLFAQVSDAPPEAPRLVVRLVRSTPPEPDLPASLSASMGLPPPATMTAGVANASLGRSAEILCRLNRADRTLGLDAAGRAALNGLTDVVWRESAEAAARFAIAPEVERAAQEEHRWLSSPPPGVEVHDPHELLRTWTRLDLPQWYVDLTRLESLHPDLGDRDAETPQGEARWRERQRQAALAAHR